MSSYNRQPVLPVLMVAAGVVLILGSIFWTMNSSPAASSAAPAVSRATDALPDDIPTQGTPRIPYPNIRRVPIADAKAAYDAKSAVFVDTRGQLYFDSEHIPGAISMTDQDLGARIGELNRNDWIITYCTWPNEESSARVAQLLIDNGFTNVSALLGGLEVWQQAGYPLEP